MRGIENGRKKKEVFPKTAKEILRIIKAADKKGELLAAMETEFFQSVSMPALWACREYIHKLPEEVYHQNTRKSMSMVAIRALLATMENDLEGAKAYVSILGSTPRHIQAKNFTEKDYFRIITELVMPYISDNQFLHIACFVRKMGVPPIQSLTLSASRPSIINGFRDFTRYGKYMMQYREDITETIRALYGDSSKGVFEIALAEWYYQNNDSFHALLLVTGTIPMMENMQDMQCLFVAMALQMKILLLNGQMQAAEPLVEKIRERIKRTGWEELTSSLNALGAWAACYDGKQEIVEEWLHTNAPDENKELYMMDMYAYLVKIRCYLLIGKYMLALILAKQLIHILEKGQRFMDLCECYMLSAFACCKAGSMDDMCDELEKALRIAKKYNYIRLLADEGAYMVRMLVAYQKKRGADTFTDEILILAGEVGKRLPNYMKSPDEYYEPLTATEKKILQFMAQGLSYQEIAEKTDKKIGTVKFHSSGIFKKLQVRNRQQAVNRAGESGLL